MDLVQLASQSQIFVVNALDPGGIYEHIHADDHGHFFKKKKDHPFEELNR